VCVSWQGPLFVFYSDTCLTFLLLFAKNPLFFDNMPRIGHLEVKVKVDDAYAPEFEDDDDEAGESDSVTTRYIEAIAGANFAIECCVLPGYVYEADSLSFQIFLDGQRAGGVHLGKRYHSRLNGLKSLETHVPQDKGSKRFLLKYRFADLDTREALPAENTEQMLSEYKMLGTISVQVWRKKHGGILKSRHPCGTKLKTGGLDAVPEKALKGRALALATWYSSPPRLIIASLISEQSRIRRHIRTHGKLHGDQED
jgi:hypothetical protein